MTNAIERGPYDSAYTMHSDEQVIEIIRDQITFQPGEDGVYIGIGEVDPDGCVMRVVIREDLNNKEVWIGVWEECEVVTGNITYHGTVQFIYDREERLVGAWNMADSQAGTWVLSSRSISEPT